MDLSPTRESELALPVAAYFEARGYRVFGEVDVAGRIADLVCVKGDEVVGVELKLTDWKAAARQATAYQLGCHFVYVALPLVAAARIYGRERAHFEREGCGLLGVNHPDGDVRVLVAPVASRRLLPFLASKLAGLTTM